MLLVIPKRRYDEYMAETSQFPAIDGDDLNSDELVAVGAKWIINTDNGSFVGVQVHNSDFTSCARVDVCPASSGDLVFAKAYGLRVQANGRVVKLINAAIGLEMVAL